MSAAIQNRFVSTVVNGFLDSRPTEDHNGNKVISWVQDSLFNAAVPKADVDNFAAGLLLDFHNSKPSTSQKRYKFHTLPASEELLKAMFEESFHCAPEILIAEAQREDPSQGSFYPLWKRVCWIQIPKGTAGVLGNILIQIAVTIGVIYLSYVFGKSAYKETTFLFTARFIPFLINNTPIQVIRAGNSILDAKDRIYLLAFPILFFSFIAQQIILLGPQIPYVTAAARNISIWNIMGALYRSPETIFGFLVGTSLDAALFVWKSCNNVSAFFSEIAIKTENERLAMSKAKAYHVWKKAMETNIPQNRTK